MKDGTEYEDKVFRLVKQLLSDKTLPYDPSLSVFHRTRSYHSADRNADIKFENVVELFAKGVDPSNGQPSLVIIFECKAYTSVVDVSEVEEFKSKLEQIKGFRAKGYMVTLRGFRRAALNYAKSNGIGLIRFIPEDQIQFVLYHMTADVMREIHEGLARRASEALTNPRYVSHHESEFGCDEGFVWGSAEAMIMKFIKSAAATAASG